jgi:hypothetical protein
MQAGAQKGTITCVMILASDSFEEARYGNTDPGNL